MDDILKSGIYNGNVFIKSSMNLSVEGSHESNISEYPEYNKYLNGISCKVLEVMQKFVDNVDGKGNVSHKGEQKTVDDIFNIVVEINDRILDRCNTTIYSIEHPESVKINNVSVTDINNVENSMSRNPEEVMKVLSKMQIERPQTKFRRQIDNSLSSFRPYLTAKPNAIEPLGSNSMDIDKDDLDMYDHPYRAELDSFSVPKKQLDLESIFEYPKKLEETPLEYIKTVAQLKEMIKKLKNVNEFAVDLEHNSYRSYLGITCLMQISTRTDDYIIDTLELFDDLEVLNEVFTDPNILKVFHGSDSDLMWLQRDFGVYVVNMFDTGHACQILNYSRKSLAFLLDKFCNITANKEFQRSDWRVRPLIKELIEYARSDTHYLLYIYDKMRRELLETTKLEELYVRCKSLCRALYQKPSHGADHYQTVLKPENFNPRQQFALQRLWELRDHIAREEDESAIFVTQNRVLLNIAQSLPREASGILACCTQEKKMPLLRKYCFDFLKICLAAYKESLKEVFVVQPPTTNEKSWAFVKHDECFEDFSGIVINTIDISKDKKEVNTSVFKNAVQIENDLEDQELICAYLKHHPLETEEELLLRKKQEALTLQKELEEARIKTKKILKRKSQCIEEDGLDEDVQIVDKPNKPEIIKPERKKMRTMNNVVPFDYEASKQNLRNKFCKRSNQKEFNPMKLKQFKGPQNKSYK